MSAESQPNLNTQKWIDIVKSKVGQIRYGTVQITVHDGRVTQIELNEKTRVDPEEGRSGGEGRSSGGRAVVISKGGRPGDRGLGQGSSPV